MHFRCIQALLLPLLHPLVFIPDTTKEITKKYFPTKLHFSQNSFHAAIQFPVKYLWRLKLGKLHLLWPAVGSVHISCHLAAIGQFQVTSSSYWWNYLSWKFFLLVQWTFSRWKSIINNENLKKIICWKGVKKSKWVGNVLCLHFSWFRTGTMRENF